MTRADRLAKTSCRRRRGGPGIMVAAAVALWASSALAQDSSSPTLPATPPIAAANDATDPDDLQTQLKKLMEMNKSIIEKYDDLSRKYDELHKKFEAKEAKEKDAKAKASDGSGGGGDTGGTSAASASQSIGGGARIRTPDEQDVGNRRLGKIPLKVNYNYGRNGFQFESENEEIQLRIRGELQTDTMIYQKADQNPVNGGFYIPRARFYFQGYFTKPIEYQLSFQRSFNTFAPLNVYLNFHYDDRFQFRVGRYKVPYLYEWYHINNWRLVGIERSLFALNFQPSRQVGMMGWGLLFDKRVEYAAGIFDGPTNSFQDFNGAKNFAGLLNFKPFEQTDSFLQNLNVGGSVDYGYQHNPLNPAVLRTSVNASSSTITSTDPLNTAIIPFLAFNNDVREQGLEALWDLHMAYFYKGLSVLGSWSSGLKSYARTGAGNRPVHVPVSGYYAQVAYILTGETIRDRVLIDPIRRFDLRRGKFGLGAFEVHSRFSELHVGEEVFTQGFADRNLWTNQTRMVDVGVNWYLNKWIRVDFDWEHAMFAQPVYYRPGPDLQKTSDLFWFRFQLFF